MVEQLNPSAPPVVMPPSVKVSGLNLDWDAGTIIIRLRALDGSYQTFTYGPNEAGPAMLIGLNKANMSVQSLHRQILNKLIADGKIQGTVSGAPD